MITVTISVNGHPIFTRSAVNQKSTISFKDGDRETYLVDDGTKIYHKKEDGSVILAKKMLDTIKEQK